MFRTPISLTDLYTGSLCFSLLLIAGTLNSGAHPIIALIALFAPPSFVTLHLVLLTEEYSERNLLIISSDVYLSFLCIGILTAIVIGWITASIWSLIWVLFIFVFTLWIARHLHKTIGYTYESVDFGFRSSLPEARLWESAIVFIQNGRKTENTLWKSVWYWMASQRFKTLVARTDPDELYSNHYIAHGYRAITSSLAQKFFPYARKHENISEIELDSILVDFTQQECYRCGRHKPVSNLYILTDDGTVSEMYCEDCVEQQQPSTSAKSRANFDSRKDEAEDTTKSRKQERRQERRQEKRREKAREKKHSQRKQRAKSHTQKSKKQTEPEEESPSENPSISEEFTKALAVFEVEYDEFTQFSEDELKQHYRTLVQEKHPDAGGDADEFKQVVEAYKFLQKKNN